MENLRTTIYNDGTPIPHILNDDEWYAQWDNINSSWEGAYCTYNNTTNAEEIKLYGCLYNWYAINTGKLCPSGWHIPTDEDWMILCNYLIANGYGYGGSGDYIGKSLASTSGWCSVTDPASIGNKQIKNNSTGFTAVPAGRRLHGGDFVWLGEYAEWWSHSDDDIIWFLGCGGGDLSSVQTLRKEGHSVRLVKN